MPKSSQKADCDLASSHRARRTVIGHGVKAKRRSLAQCRALATGTCMGEKRAGAEIERNRNPIRTSTAVVRLAPRYFATPDKLEKRDRSMPERTYDIITSSEVTPRVLAISRSSCSTDGAK